MTIIVGISGANGTMGRLTIGAIDGVDDLTVGGLYAPGRDDQDILGYTASGDPAVLSECNVIIELTNPTAADENVPRWRDNGADVLIGTSGFTTDRIESLRNAWSDLDSRCLVVPHAGSGDVRAVRAAKPAAPPVRSPEIVEMHHHDKPDAASGTALHTAARMAAARGHGSHARGSEIAAGALGSDVEGIPVHSLRLHGSVAHQEVVFGTIGQYLTVRHDTTDYQCFAPGILLALREIRSLEPGVTVGLDGLLGV